MEEKAEGAHLFSHFGSVAQCVAHLPYAYRASLKAKFFALADVAEKRGRVYKTYETLRHHHRTGTYPSQLEAVREPIFQFTKEYLEMEQVSGTDNVAAKMHNEWVTFRATMLNNVIERKRAELEFLEGKLRPSAFREDIMAAVRAVWESQRQIYGLAAIGEHTDVPMEDGGNGTTTPTQSSSGTRRGVSGDATIIDWMDTDYALVKIDSLALASRVVDIIRLRDIVEIQKWLQKLRQQHTATDAEPDANVAREQALDERVTRLVQSALAKQKGKAKKGPDAKKGKKKGKNPRGKKIPASVVTGKGVKKKIHR